MMAQPVVDDLLAVERSLHYVPGSHHLDGVDFRVALSDLGESVEDEVDRWVGGGARRRVEPRPIQASRPARVNGHAARSLRGRLINCEQRRYEVKELDWELGDGTLLAIRRSCEAAWDAWDLVRPEVSDIVNTITDLPPRPLLVRRQGTK